MEFRYSPRAIRGLYQIPRGVAAEVTEAIKRLAKNATPPESEPLTGRLNTFRIRPAGHLVEYEVVKGHETIIKLLIID